MDVNYNPLEPLSYIEVEANLRLWTQHYNRLGLDSFACPICSIQVYATLYFFPHTHCTGTPSCSDDGWDFIIDEVGRTKYVDGDDDGDLVWCSSCMNNRNSLAWHANHSPLLYGSGEIWL